jgi:hypothetical protein
MLPKIRAEIEQEQRMLLQIADQVAASSGLGEAEQAAFAAAEAFAHRLRFADLWMVSAPMRDAALDAARDIPPTPIASVWPARTGIVAYDQGLPAVDNPRFGTGRPVVLRWTADEHFAYVAMDAPGSEFPGSFPREIGMPWVPLGSCTVPIADPIDFDDYRPDTVRMVSLLLATWILADTPTVADARHTTQAGPKIGSGRRRAAPSTVRVVEMRRLARTPAEPTDDTDGSGRVYRHQWVVRGHCRQQPYGEGRLQRRTTWVPSYLKGPEGAPFLPSEQVFVWRR